MTHSAVETPLQVFEHEPFLQVTWRDSMTPARGFVVIDQLVTGIATGGLRMRPGCTVGEVAELAREMTLKMGAFGIHVGGAKGGIDFDPTDPRADEVRERFLEGVRPLLERFWVTAGDLGTQQEQLDQAFQRVGIGDTSFHAAVVRSDDEAEVRSRIQQAFTTRTEGLLLSELIGGYGVAEAALAALEHREIPAATASAVVQGFGAMGGSTALYLAHAGVKIVGVTDAQGMIVNESRGLDVELLLSARRTGGVIDRSLLREDDVEAPGDEWLGMDVDVLVPAAVGHTITADNCDRIRGQFVVEAANVPTTPEAEQRLLERGITVVPDFIANTGAAAGAWWVILGEVVSPSGACSRLSAQMRPLVRDLLSRADESGMSMRTEGIKFACDNSQHMISEYGGAVAFRDLFPAVPQGQQFTVGDADRDQEREAQPEEAVVAEVEAAVVEAVENVVHPPNGALPEGADLVESPLENGRRPAAAFPAYYPGPADESASGQP
ncbi:Glu/Leu/Phe/Val dehydrogenase dimerization domain-containing protein [Streptomyces marispadix]|uniref:Glutamate dehydrogenase n=1 Tax=Streptomyces marispadix TaxID=2922868 RepID=A0ABS9STR2_9ACTN|nr:Glu/Leu/Phe/Val dehydrogenase dimerization domain-containing protein [Streptomyces marispadix]MCH6159652.1 glutamate dehydrogenase [Streptomyces marispadix]